MNQLAKFILCFGFVLWISIPGFGQNFQKLGSSSILGAIGNEATSQEIGKWITQLTDKDSHVRYMAVFELGRLKYGLKNERVRKALLELAEREKEKYMKRDFGPGEYGEGYMEYIHELMTALASLKDPRTIPYLSDEVGSFSVVDEGFLALGEVAAEALLNDFESGPVSDRMGREERKRALYMSVFSLMVRQKENGYTAKGETRDRMKRAALGLCKSDEGWLRQQCARFLGDLGDPDVIPILENLVANDPYKLDFLGDPYVVRDTARVALAKFPEVQKRRLKIEKKLEAGLLASSVTTAVKYPIATTPAAQVSEGNGKVAEKTEKAEKIEGVFSTIWSNKYVVVGIISIVFLIVFFSFLIRMRSR